jgi:molecular chaperone DnaK
MAADNRLLGRFLLDGIPPAPRGVPQIEVSFDIDANGILNVSAKDLGTQKAKSIRVESSSGISKDEIDRMKKDAESHAEEDKKKRKQVDLKNSSDQLIYSTEKLLSENASIISEGDRTRINSILDRLRAARDQGDVAAMEKTQAELQKASQDIGKAIYEKAASSAGTSSQGSGAGPGGSGGAGQGRPEGPAQGGGDDNVIDADYEVKS